MARRGRERVEGGCRYWIGRWGRVRGLGEG